MRVYLVIRAKPDGFVPSGLFSYDPRPYSAGAPDRKILPVDLDDAEIAGLFNIEDACPQCNGEAVVDASFTDDTPVMCDECNGTGHAGGAR